MCVAAAIAGGTLAGAAISSSASKSAANTEAGAANNATAAQTALAQQELALQQSNSAPYRKAGSAALSQIENVLGLNGAATGAQDSAVPGSLQNSSTSATGTAPGGFNPNNIPGYTYGLNQADQAITNQNDAMYGGGLNGNTLKALQGAGQAYAGTAYQNYLGNLGGIASMGQASAENSAQQGSNTLGQLSGQVGSNITGAGNAIAAGTVGAANNITGSINSGLNTWTQQQTLNSLFGNTGGATSSGPASIVGDSSGGTYSNPYWASS
jgi:hypothetical protein